MFQIRHGKQLWVVEHSAGKFERHTVFANIGIRFDLVPFELKHPTIHDVSLLPSYRNQAGDDALKSNHQPVFRCSTAVLRAADARKTAKVSFPWASGSGLKRFCKRSQVRLD